jgi:hypothetical protein
VSFAVRPGAERSDDQNIYSNSKVHNKHVEKERMHDCLRLNLDMIELTKMGDYEGQTPAGFAVVGNNICPWIMAEMALNLKNGQSSCSYWQRWNGESS